MCSTPFYEVDEELKTLTFLYNEPETDELDAVAVYPRSATVIPDSPNADLITDDPTIDLGTTATMISHNVYAGLPLEVMNLPSPKVGTVVRVDVYDDSQTFTTTDDVIHCSGCHKGHGCIPTWPWRLRLTCLAWPWPRRPQSPGPSSPAPGGSMTCIWQKRTAATPGLSLKAPALGSNSTGP